MWLTRQVFTKFPPIFEPKQNFSCLMHLDDTIIFALKTGNLLEVEAYFHNHPINSTDQVNIFL